MKRRDFIKIGSIAGASLAACRTGLFANAQTGGGAGGTGSAGAAGGAQLARGFARAFANAPASSRPGGYWWWLDGQVSRAGITRDMEEFVAKGSLKIKLFKLMSV